MERSTAESRKETLPAEAQTPGEPAELRNPGGPKSAWWRPVLLLGVIVAILILARVFGLGEKLGALREWLLTLGPWGPLVFVLIYLVGVVAALPGAALTIAAGALFGSVLGVIVVNIGATIGASLAFLIGRYFARDAVVNWLSKSAKFQKLDQLTEAHGAIIVALTRLVPIFPFNLLNYGFGLTKVPFWTYVFWSWLCTLPGTILYVVGADAVTKALMHGGVPWVLVGAFVGALLLLTLLVRAAKRQLRFKELHAATGSPADIASLPAMPEISPQDAYNQTLVANVRPPDWINPKPAPRYNLVVIGGGTAGLVSAAGAAGLGAKVALVERHLLGGDCLNYGCVPSKAIIRSARVAAELRDAPRFGLKVLNGPEIDFPAVMERMRRLRSEISQHDAVARFRALGVDVFLGAARFTGANTVAVEDQALHFKKAVIATGGRAVQPAIPGLAEAGYLTNETVFSLTQRPARLLIIGGGPLGCEFAQAFQRLGCQVTLLHKYERLMNREDVDAAKLIQRVFLKEGINLILNAKPLQVSKTPTGKLVQFESNGATGEVEVDEILIGAGRAPNVEGLDLEAAGVQYEAGKGRGVLVNDKLQTSNPNIYAAGDICLPYQFTHLADAAARIVIQNALFFGRKKLSALTIPWCTYTDPEVAHVGLSESEAARQGVQPRTFIKPLSEVDRAMVDGETEGFVKIQVKPGTDKILGATIVASHAGEMISEITAAMVGNLGLGTLANIIHPYPTQAEAIRQMGDLYNRTRLTPGLKRLFAKFLAWRR
jgi:pyruvate/2-oxoglutarate dehydrogenase complex dihydrolipoamide dehydrogenase (E3) component/uncharacterized membrane protein YdjX (TVP38/TMEM64 family)